MKRNNVFCALVCLICQSFYAGVVAQDKRDLTVYVNPNIGTAHSRWFFYTPGASPFGMAKPAPSTNGHYGNKDGWEAVGYDERHNSIEGFANFHEFQIGGIVFAPTVGELRTVPGELGSAGIGYRSDFDRKDEFATAGYYSVMLKNYGIKAELSSTPRVAFHRYTFPEGNQSNIIFDIGNRQGESGPVKDAKVVLTADGRVEGYVVTLPTYVQKYQQGAEVRMYFSAEISKQPSTFGTFHGKLIERNSRQASGTGAGLYLTFDTKRNEPVTIKAGLSYTSIENARRNLTAEAADLDFDSARNKCKNAWNAYLHRIEVESPRKSDMVKFYTGLYHALLGRGLASDVNGAYPKHDGTVGQIALGSDNKPLFNHYNTDAIWGAFWNLTQLWSVAYPEYLSDFVNSQILNYKDSGWLGDGIACSKWVSGVGTNFVSLVIAGAYNAGIRDFDIKAGYQASLKNEVEASGRPLGAGKIDVGRFVKYGYVDHIDKSTDVAEAWMFSASHTLEYSFSSYAVAQWAEALGKNKDYQQLMRLARGWEKLYDPQYKLIRPKYADGRFIPNFKPYQVWRGFQEGNAFQYSFYVPHDPRGLIKKIGKEEFVHRLDSVFNVSKEGAFGGGKTLDAFSGLAAPYNHGNQPNLHIAWLFNFADRPSLTQKWVREICNDFYGTDGIHGYGYGQDEDQGQLGAWYVISSLGLFDVKGMADRDTEMGLGSPLFNKIRINLSQKYYGGKTFVIAAPEANNETPYVAQWTLNGKTIDKPFIKFTDIIRGGELIVRSSKEPVDKY